jgi:hypothetical protein
MYRFEQAFAIYPYAILFIILDNIPIGFNHGFILFILQKVSLRNKDSHTTKTSFPGNADLFQIFESVVEFVD